DEGVDVLLRVRQVDGIDAQANVGGVLARLAAPRNLDQFDGGLVQGMGKDREAIPVRVGLLGDDLSFLDDPLEYAGDIEAFSSTLEAKRQVLEIDENGQGAFHFSHGNLGCAVSRDPVACSVTIAKKVEKSEGAE